MKLSSVGRDPCRPFPHLVFALKVELLVKLTYNVALDNLSVARPAILPSLSSGVAAPSQAQSLCHDS